MENDNFDLNNKSILIVDDETDLREIVAGELEFMGANVFQAENIHHAQELLSLHSIDLIISDIRMPGGSGVELLEIVKEKLGEDFPVILITGFADITPMDAYAKGAEALISKPFQLDELFKITAKHASRKNDHWNEVLETHKKVEPLGERIIIGRGGVSFFVDSRERIEPGEGIRFDLKIQGKHLGGTGICRWIKTSSTGSAVLGLEFSSIDHDHWKELSQFKRSKAYIPSVTEL